jgi:hypothetical protein
MPTALIGAAITGGASLVGGLLGKKKTTTQVQAPTYTPGQQQIQDRVQTTLNDRLANPGAQFNPLKVQALDQNNQNFKVANDNLETKLASRGFAGSGKFAGGLRSNEVSRIGNAGRIEADFAGREVEQQNKTLQDALRFSFANPGGKSTSDGGSNVAGGAVAGGAQTATFLYALQKMLSGGGGFGGGSGSGETGFESSSTGQFGDVSYGEE